jgi:hypothetical protein
MLYTQRESSRGISVPDGHEDGLIRAAARTRTAELCRSASSRAHYRFLGKSLDALMVISSFR